MNVISFRWYGAALLVLWGPTIGGYCACCAAEKWFRLKPGSVDAIVAVPLCLALLGSATCVALAVNEGLRKYKTAWGQTVIVLLGVCFGAMNLVAWVLAYLWFYIDFMHRDSF